MRSFAALVCSFSGFLGHHELRGKGLQVSHLPGGHPRCSPGRRFLRLFRSSLFVLRVPRRYGHRKFAASLMKTDNSGRR